MSSISAGLAVLGGMLTVLSPCVLPILPVVVGRSLQSHRYTPLAMVAGLIVGFATIGSLIGVTASWLAGLASLLRIVAIALLLIAGILAIFPSWSYQIFACLRLIPRVLVAITQIFLKFAISSGGFKQKLREKTYSSEKPASTHAKIVKQPKPVGLWGEFCLGTQLGLLWTPCAGTVLSSILVLAAVKHDTKSAFVLLLLYGLGAAIPILAIAYGGRYFSRNILKLRSYSQILQRVGGAIVAVTAIAILLGWDVQIQLAIAPFFPALRL